LGHPVLYGPTVKISLAEELEVLITSLSQIDRNVVTKPKWENKVMNFVMECVLAFTLDKSTPSPGEVFHEHATR